MSWLLPVCGLLRITFSINPHANNEKGALMPLFYFKSQYKQVIEMLFMFLLTNLL